MKLQQKRARFTSLVGKLLAHAESIGFEVTLGETIRSEAVAKWNASQGIGIANSLHGVGLAVDINLFRNGIYLTKSEDYEVLGKWWEKQSTHDLLCCWGGRFKRADGNHFSVEHNGVR